MRAEHKLLNKLKGYHPTPRGKYLLLKNKILTKEEFLLYDASFSFADWDKQHTDTYGVVDLTQGEIELLLGTSKGFVSRYSRPLISKGFWQKIDVNRVRVSGFELIEVGLLKEIVKKQGVVDVYSYTQLQNHPADKQHSSANIQHTSPKAVDQSQDKTVANMQHTPSISDLVSSKVNYPRGDKEYLAIWNEMGCPANFTSDDMRWIDLNVTENVPTYLEHNYD